MPRRRRRRSDSSENLDGLDEDLDDWDVRITSLEEELRNVSLSAAVQARDTQALRARIEELEEGPVEDEAFEELDALTKRFEDHVAEQSRAQKVLAERLGELIVRLDTVGGLGRLEDLPRLLEDQLMARLEDRLTVLGENLESRFRSLELAFTEGGGASAAQIEALTTEVEATVSTLRDELDQVLRETQHELSQALQEAASQEEVEAMADKLEKELTSSRIRLEEGLAQVQTAGIPDDLHGLLASKASVEDFEALRAALEDLQDSAGLSERAQTALSRIEEMAAKGAEWEERLSTLLERSELNARLVERHEEKVALAVGLVRTLEEKARGVSGQLEGVDLPSDEAGRLGFELDDLLQVMAKHGASDLHLVVGQPPTVRLEGELIPVGNQALAKGDCQRLVFSALSAVKRRQLADKKDLECLYRSGENGFKLNVFLERGNVSATFHAIPASLPALESLGLPVVLQKLVVRPKGLLLVISPPGEGRSTTLSALVNFLNINRKIRIVTLERSLEFHHSDRMALITQRELGVDVVSVAEGLRWAVRQDPDVVMVEELTNREATERALELAQGRALVLAGVRGSTVEAGLKSLVGLFEQGHQKRRGQQLSSCLVGSIAQRLLDRTDGAGKVAAAEVLVNTPTISRLLAEGNLPAVTQQLFLGDEGMQTLSQSLARLVETGVVSQEQAQSLAETPPPSPATPPPVASEPEVATDDPGLASPAVNDQDTLMNWL